MKKSRAVRNKLNISNVSPINLNETVRSIESDASLIQSSTGAKIGTNTTSSFKNIMPNIKAPSLLKWVFGLQPNEPKPIAQEEEVKLEEVKGEWPVNEEAKARVDQGDVLWRQGFLLDEPAIEPVQPVQPVQPSRLTRVVKGIPNVAKQTPGKAFDALIMSAVEIKAA